jgi:hypothetical protein
MFNPDPAFLFVQKLKSAPRIKAELEKIFSMCPKLLINAELYMALYWPQGWKKDTIEFGRPICNPWG